MLYSTNMNNKTQYPYKVPTPDPITVSMHAWLKNNNIEHIHLFENIEPDIFPGYQRYIHFAKESDAVWFALKFSQQII
jgi:hypothetical protein